MWHAGVATAQLQVRLALAAWSQAAALPLGLEPPLRLHRYKAWAAQEPGPRPVWAVSLAAPQAGLPHTPQPEASQGCVSAEGERH